MSYHLIDLIQRIGRPHVLVLGDLILDRYVWGDAERISQEAPVILLRQDREEIRLGGAANVANMLSGLEADVTIAGVVGDDADGTSMREELESTGVSCDGLIADSTRPTTVKERYIGRAQHRHPHQMLRVDRETRRPLSDEPRRELLDRLIPTLGDYQAVLISDYAKGVCTPEVLEAVIAACRERNVPVIVDPASVTDYRHYTGATAITPNRLETERATGREIRSIEEAKSAGIKLCAQLNLSHAFITLDSDGIVLALSDGSTELLPTRKREVYDITGAGDMVLATIGVGTAAGIAPVDLARLANIAGGLEVEQIGVVTVTREEMLRDLIAGGRGNSDKISTLEGLVRHVEARRSIGQRIVFTNGCFDVLHLGHVSYLQQAAREGDCLIVAINSDESVRSLDKSPDRPIFGQDDRSAMLAALEAVDYVIVFDEATPHVVLERLKPDLLVKGGTYSHDEIVGWELVEGYGGQVKPMGAVPGVSTTELLKRLRGETREFPRSHTERKAG
jgi:D-beta-D-heptose 7-phosphate kinase/D-beta-D-heptose 1-phosphate adenosyltransferase